MDENELLDILNNIETKVGEDIAPLIKDDLGDLITRNNQVLSDNKTLNEKYTNSQKENENLKAVNNRLYQQIPVGIDDLSPTIPNKNKVQESIDDFDFHKMFDSKGKFKKTLD